MRDADARGQLPSGAVGPDAIEGLAAFARGDDAAAIRWLAPHLDDMVRIGGSHAQRDLFTHTLMATYLHDDRIDGACALQSASLGARIEAGVHSSSAHGAASSAQGTPLSW